MKRRPLVLGLVLALLLGGGTWYGVNLASRRATVLRHLPATPDLSALPAALAENVADATAQARSWRHTVSGLAELSRLYHANGFYPEALACYDALRRLEPANARWPHLQASIITNFGRLDEALPLRRLAVELDPSYLPARVRLGDVLLKDNQAAAASEAYAETLRRDPGNAYALLGLARCDLGAGDWTRARERLQSAVAQNPDFIGALSLLVTVSEHFGDRETAAALRNTIGRREFTDLPDPWLDDLAEVCFDAYRLSVAAAIASSAGHADTALALLDRAIALAPKAGSYHRQAGQIHLNGHNFTAARAHLEQAVAINPTDSDAWLQLINTLRGLGQEQAALNTLLKGLSLCPKSPSLHLEYARWLRAAGRLDEAITEFRYGYELRPSEASPLVELASVYFAANQNQAALDALHLALERQPDHPMALATLTFYAISQHDEPAAQQRWAQVRRQTKTPPEVVDGLRQAFQQQFGRPPP
jgi:tetratricopeptide (TPR) repeat protein